MLNQEKKELRKATKVKSLAFILFYFYRMEVL